MKSRRLRIVWVCMGSALLGLLFRLFDLSILERDFLLKQSHARIVRNVIIPGHRGILVDRLGDPLAVSTTVKSVWINPQLFDGTKKEIQTLANALQVSPRFILEQSRKKEKEFVYLKRKVPPNVASVVNNLKLNGLYFQSEYQRYYPQGEISAHMVGFTDIDDQGREGLEFGLNTQLRGLSGKKEVVKDRLGNIIAEIAVHKPPMEGKNIQLSIDQRIQYLAYQALKKAVERVQAKSGSAVVLDVNTGEVLAMVNQPSYNPNNRQKTRLSAFRNRAVTDLFEPGSVIKPFTIAFALESGKYNPMTLINTSPGSMTIGGYRIHDELDYGLVTVTELLQKSSNIAAAKILLSLDPIHFWDLLKKVGFGEKTTSGFPGEVDGVVAPQTTWVPSVVATLAYGYGISVTPLQLAQAYAVLAAGGLKRPISLLKINESVVPGERVLPEHITREVITMLETVLKKGGTGTRAAVGGYRVAGKTGTAYIAGPHGYYHNRYVGSFVGMAPAEHPRLVVAVVIKDPKKAHLGGIVAAPVFSEIMRGALRFLNVPPS